MVTASSDRLVLERALVNAIEEKHQLLQGVARLERELAAAKAETAAKAESKKPAPRPRKPTS